MRSLTLGEATTVRSMLASEDVSERERIRRSKIPSRTFEGARQRAYSEGWVFDRYLPDPARLGRPLVHFVLARPHAEKLDLIRSRWQNDGSNVVLWQWPEALFAVFLTAAGSRIAEFSDQLGVAQPSVALTADVRKPQIPAYFDFEGSWSRILGVAGAVAYPQSLPKRMQSNGETRTYSDLKRKHVQELVSRANLETGAIRPLRTSPFFLPRSDQRLIADGSVDRRTFLDPRRIPPYDGREIDSMGFVHGELTAGATPAALFLRLATIRVTPFLFATNGKQVLLGAISLSPRVTTSTGVRPAVLANLQRFMKEIQIVREPVSALKVVVNHRYDRLFSADR
jgi:hypothetical protein